MLISKVMYPPLHGILNWFLFLPPFSMLFYIHDFSSQQQHLSNCKWALIYTSRNKGFFSPVEEHCRGRIEVSLCPWYSNGSIQTGILDVAVFRLTLHSDPKFRISFGNSVGKPGLIFHYLLSVISQWSRDANKLQHP